MTSCGGSGVGSVVFSVSPETRLSCRVADGSADIRVSCRESTKARENRMLIVGI